jgi:hypothetical protein
MKYYIYINLSFIILMLLFRNEKIWKVVYDGVDWSAFRVFRECIKRF